MSYESLLSELKQMNPVSIEAIDELAENQELLVELVSNRIINKDILTQAQWKNFSKNTSNDQFRHISFMCLVFRFGAYEALLKTQLWLDRVAYANKLPQGAIVDLNRIWIESFEEVLSPESSEAITQVYKWVIHNHDKIASLYVPNSEYGIILDESLNRVRENLLVHLIIGDFCKCLSISSEFVNETYCLLEFYLQILQPCMYEIGYLWENGDITTAQEHLASNMVNRLMSYIYTKADMVTNVSNKAIVTTAPGEFHELGARMIADFLEIYGWKVNFLGTNTPIDCLIDQINRVDPHILAVSATMFYNIGDVEKLISNVKEQCKNKNLKVIVGGQAFRMEPDIWKAIGADGYSDNAQQAVVLARKLAVNTEHR